MTTFKIINGTYPDREGLKKDYLSREYSSEELIEKYNVNRNLYWRITREAREEYYKKTGEEFNARTRTKKQRKTKNYYWNYHKKFFEVFKYIKGHKTYYGVFKTREEAEKAVQICKNHNWNITTEELYQKVKT